MLGPPAVWGPRLSGVLCDLGVLLLRHRGQDHYLVRRGEVLEGTGVPFDGLWYPIGDRSASLHLDLVVRYLLYRTCEGFGPIAGPADVTEAAVHRGSLGANVDLGTFIRLGEGPRCRARARPPLCTWIQSFRRRWLGCKGVTGTARGCSFKGLG